MDEELLLLQQQLAQVQLVGSEQRLSERNVVTLILKLIKWKQVDLVYTLTGKEYLTKKQLAVEIEDEITARGGRVRLDEISASLNIDIISVDNAVQKLVEENDEIKLLDNIEIITSWYLDKATSEWNELLQEKGKITIGEIATKYSLPVDVVQSAVTSRLGDTLRANLNKNVLYTESFVEQQRAKIRGILLASTQPISLNKLSSKYELDAKMCERLVKDMIKDEVLPGRFGSGEYIPLIHSRMQRSTIDSFFETNRYIDLVMFKKMNIKSPHKFLSESFKEIILLDSCIVSSDLLHNLEASIDECVANESIIEAKTGMPPQLTEKDCNTLLNKCGAVKSKKMAKAKVFAGHYVVSKPFLEKASLILKTISEDAGKKSIKERPAKNSSQQTAAPKTQTRVAEKSKAKKKKGKSKRRKGDISDEEDDYDTSNAKSSVDDYLVSSLKKFLNVSQLSKQLRNKEEMLNEFDTTVADEIVSENISKMRGWYTTAYTEAMSAVHHGDAAKRRTKQTGLEKEFLKIFPTFKLFFDSLCKFSEEVGSQPESSIIDDIQKDYLLLKGFDLIGILLEYQCAQVDVEFKKAEIEKDTSELRRDVDFCKDVISRLPGPLPKQFKLFFSFLLKDGVDLGGFVQTIEDFAGQECGFVTMKLDKKTERSMIHGRRTELLSRLSQQNDPQDALVLAIMLVFQQGGGILIPDPNGKEGNERVSSLLPLLNKYLNEERLNHFTSFAKIEDVNDEKFNTLLELIRETAQAKDPKSL